jgi:YVTN family beta-propeller protein
MSVSLTHRLSLFLGLFTVLAVVAAYFLLPARSAADDVQIAQNVPTQGRTLTPAGKLLADAATNQTAVMPLTVNFVRSPDGRFLAAVNSGWGLQFKSSSPAQQTISIIDLAAKPEPQVIQNIYFPTPQSANVGLTFSQKPDADGNYRMFVAGGFENKIWLFRFNPQETQPVAPANKPDERLTAPFIDVSAFTENAPSPYYNNNAAPVYPTGIALAPDNNTLFVANNLGDSLGIVTDLRDTRQLTRISLRRPNSTQMLYPYDVKILTNADGKTADKAYVSLWADASVAVVNLKAKNQLSHIAVDRHPTAMLLNKARTRLYVVNSNADTVSVIDTKTDKLIEKINVKLADNAPIGASPEGLALSEDERTLYVANAHANAVAVVSLEAEESKRNAKSNAKLLGFIPTGNYASAVAVVGNQLFIANGKGTGVENSSNNVNNSGRNPNAPNENYPGTGGYNKRGQYSASVVSGNISVVTIPNDKQLYAYTQQTMRNNGLLGQEKRQLFAGGRSPFKHVIYIIRENRTYDQVFGDLATSGDGTKADGQADLAIFGAGDAAKSPNGAAQNITPNARALALRFGLLDRFFVNAEASPDGHNWSTAAFSNDFVDKAFRWNYSRRGRTYDFEGFNRLPSFEPPANQPPGTVPTVFDLPATEVDIANYMKRFVPYLQGNRDVGEPETLYLWDAAQRAGLTYRNYGEFIATVSEAEVTEINTRKSKPYPDISPTKTAFATKKSLEGNYSPTFRNYDMYTPDSMTIDSYRAFQEKTAGDPIISDNNADQRFRGNSRLGEWIKEFRGYVANLNSGKGDRLPNLSIVRFSNDHTAGLRPGVPTPAFFVAENDYALGKLVEEVSNSPYWRDTAIFVVEDDAQDGPDHVDAHRSPGFVISAYNRKGALVHEFHNTVSLIRTMEICLGIPPMNFLDANAVPIDMFTNTPDFAPYQAIMPDVALDNLVPPARPSTAMLKYFELTNEQNLTHADMANPRQLNEIIWFSVKGETQPIPEIARHPAFDLMTAGIKPEDEDEEDEEREEYKKSERLAERFAKE